MPSHFAVAQLNDNALPLVVGGRWRDVNSRSLLRDISDATSHLIDAFRCDATTLCVGLADLELPALVTLEILDAALPNSIPMHKKWDLVVAVKHWHQRHGIERQ